MPHAIADGVRLYYEEEGMGIPLVFVHEFSGDYRSWELEVRFFSRRYRCIRYNARGYPPSDVPSNLAAYSQARAADDIRAVLDHLQLENAHVIGLSMGGFATLHFGLKYPQRARSLVIGSCGYGASTADRSAWEEGVEHLAQRYEQEGAAGIASTQSQDPYRIQLQNKDAIGWQQYVQQLSEHDSLGATMTLRGVQKTRPSLFELESDLRLLAVPTLIVVGDEDEPCVEPGVWLKRTIGPAALAVFPKTGHTVNLEEPALFHRTLLDFFTWVDSGRWETRDPRSLQPDELNAR